MSQFNAPTYDIAKPTGICAVTGRTLEPGERFIAMLVEFDESEQPEAAEGATTATGLGFKRLDVSLDAWQQPGERPEHLYCHWQTTVPQPNEKKRLFVDDAVLMNLLVRLADTDQPQRLAFRFVLALILMRKKFLRYDRTEKRPAEGGGEQMQEWWHVTPKLDLSKGPLGKWDDAHPLEILNPQLDEQQITDVTEQLSEILEAEL